MNFSKRNPIFYLLIFGLILWSIINLSGQTLWFTNTKMPSSHPTLMFLLGACLAIALFTLVFLLGYHRKKEISPIMLGKVSMKQTEDQQTEKEVTNKSDSRQKLLALDLMLKSEEEERRRISQDIHEGLGNLLSSIRYSIHSHNDQKDTQAMIKQATTLIDQAIGETRRIAYYVMPGSLMALGLVPALEDLCQSHNQEFDIKTRFQSFGIDERLEPALEYAVYRLVQGALNNILKFAEASEALVQITRENYTLHVLIEDDGEGFDVKAYGPLSETYSYKAIYARISYLDGKMKIESEEGKGTSLMIEIPIEFKPVD